MAWSAQQYTLFESERTRPVRDLLSAVPPREVAWAADLGCGPGNSTEILLHHYPDAAITGIDTSTGMLAAARERLPGLRFQQADIARWQPDEPYDLILANASLQWIPDHAALFPELIRHLTPGGSLAVQMPDNQDEPVKTVMREVASDPRWAGRIGDERSTRFPRHPVPWYYDLLKPHCSRVDIWRTVYWHVLPGGVDAIVEWFKGSALRPFLALLEADDQAAFLHAYRQALVPAYPVQADGSVLLPIPRLFLVATR
ncbi:trans-aconitate 2-methyltransferase [Castellaniella sp.]|uniref:trans-aconitate 2-methyltransferase n=1 Tax=Castellaniella sp. TaxID=1955812 RepID=UPI002AFF10CF|nr:trans-aconitate 2-methyltransferase [Castellaniella sp.]